MNSHQKAWLKANPHRSAAWLKERLADGFDIHHLDGNHENNDPLNLLLIEVMDHMRLHDLPLQRISAAKIRSDKKKPATKTTMDLECAEAHSRRKQSDRTYIGISKTTARESSILSAEILARSERK
jgi:hypothetical protein